MTVSPGGLPPQNCEIASNRWIRETTFGTETHSLSSPDWEEILLPRSFKNWQAVSLSGPTAPQLTGRYIYLPNLNISHTQPRCKQTTPTRRTRTSKNDNNRGPPYKPSNRRKSGYKTTYRHLGTKLSIESMEISNIAHTWKQPPTLAEAIPAYYYAPAPNRRGH